VKGLTKTSDNLVANCHGLNIQPLYNPFRRMLFSEPPCIKFWLMLAFPPDDEM
jgi:hypothetical protein